MAKGPQYEALERSVNYEGRPVVGPESPRLSQPEFTGLADQRNAVTQFRSGAQRRQNTESKVNAERSKADEGTRQNADQQRGAAAKRLEQAKQDATSYRAEARRLFEATTALWKWTKKALADQRLPEVRVPSSLDAQSLKRNPVNGLDHSLHVAQQAKEKVSASIEELLAFRGRRTTWITALSIIAVVVALIIFVANASRATGTAPSSSVAPEPQPSGATSQPISKERASQPAVTRQEAWKTAILGKWYPVQSGSPAHVGVLGYEFLRDGRSRTYLYGNPAFSGGEDGAVVGDGEGGYYDITGDTLNIRRTRSGDTYYGGGLGCPGSCRILVITEAHLTLIYPPDYRMEYARYPSPGWPPFPDH